MSFEKGKSGNPGGRPKKSQEQLDFERKCREYASLFSIERLKKWAQSENAMASMAALKEIHDRGFGKSEAVSYVEANVTAPSGFSAQELAERGAKLLGVAPSGNSGVDSGPGVDSGK